MGKGKRVMLKRENAAGRHFVEWVAKVCISCWSERRLYILHFAGRNMLVYACVGAEQSCVPCFSGCGVFTLRKCPWLSRATSDVTAGMSRWYWHRCLCTWVARLCHRGVAVRSVCRYRWTHGLGRQRNRSSWVQCSFVITLIICHETCLRSDSGQHSQAKILLILPAWMAGSAILVGVRARADGGLRTC